MNHIANDGPTFGRDDAARHSGILPYRWEVVALLWFAYFLNQADRQIFGVTLPLLKAEFQLSAAQLGFVATTFTVVFGVLVPVAGIAGDRFRREWVVVFSLLIFSAGTLMTGISSGLIALLLFRGLATGAGEAFYAPAANTLVTQHHGERRGRALAVHQTANYTGVVLGSLIAGWLADRHGWRAAFLAFGLAGIVWVAVIVWRARRVVVERSPVVLGPAGGTSLRHAAGRIVRCPELLAQVIGFSGLVFVLVGFLTWTPSILAERFGLSLASAGFQAVVYHHAVAYMGLLIIGSIGDKMAQRNPRFRVYSMAASLILSAPFLYLSAVAPSAWLVYVGLGGFGLFRGIYDGSLYAAMADFTDDRERATIAGLILAVAYVVGALAPFVMGFLADRYGFGVGLMMLAGASITFGTVMLVVLVTSSGRPTTAGIRL